MYIYKYNFNIYIYIYHIISKYIHIVYRVICHLETEMLYALRGHLSHTLPATLNSATHTQATAANL